MYTSKRTIGNLEKMEKEIEARKKRREEKEVDAKLNTNKTKRKMEV